MITAWRITKTTDIRKAFSGEGSRLYGGRWNSKGIAVDYAAATRSLAMLEILVHMRNTRQTVPSVIVPEERNYILNPGHALFAQIKFGSPVFCKFDPRLL